MNTANGFAQISLKKEKYCIKDYQREEKINDTWDCL